MLTRYSTSCHAVPLPNQDKTKSSYFEELWQNHYQILRYPVGGDRYFLGLFPTDKTHRHHPVQSIDESRGAGWNGYQSLWGTMAETH